MQNDNLKFKSYFWILLDLVLVAMFLNIVFAVMPTITKLGRSFASARTLSATAEGRTFAAPDIAQISFSVVSRGQDPVKLADENNKKINAAIEFVKSQGIDAKDVKTAGYNLNPDYYYNPDTQRSVITGYTLTQTVSVKIRDFSKISPILGGLPPLGINQISGVSFTIDDPEKFLAQAREEAFKKARAKAETIAAQNGVSLGRVMGINEGGPGPILYYAKNAEFGVGGGGPITAPTVEPGQEELTVSVTVTYELR